MLGNSAILFRGFTEFRKPLVDDFRGRQPDFSAEVLVAEKSEMAG